MFQFDITYTNEGTHRYLAMDNGWQNYPLSEVAENLAYLRILLDKFEASLTIPITLTQRDPHS